MRPRIWATVSLVETQVTCLAVWSSTLSESATLWVLGILIGINSSVIGVLFVMLWSHIQQCRKSGEDRAASLARLETQQERIMADIGTHDSGLRGDVHSLRTLVTPMVLWVEGEKERRK